MAGSRTHFFWVQTLHCLLPRAVEMSWLQLAAALGRGAAAGTTGAAPAGEIVILNQDKDEVAYLGSRSIAKPDARMGHSISAL